MLLELPHEIILQIARKLAFRDKLRLVTTCRELYDLIFNWCLYEKVVMTRDEEETKSIMNKFKDNQISSHQVKEIWYHLTLLSDEVFVQLPEVFSSVTRYVDISPPNCKQRRTGTPTSQLIKWKDTLEEYSYIDDWFKMASLLENHLFSRLNFLHLSCSPGGSWEGNVGRNINLQACLKNAPSLKELRLLNCVITIDLLETICASCVQLQTFNIKESLYLMDNDNLPPKIVPAKQLYYLEVTGLTSFLDQNCIFFEYFNSKFTGLKELKFFPILVDDIEKLSIRYPDEFKHQSMKSNNDSNASTLTKKIALTHRLYRSETTRFFSHLPDTIKKLEMSGDMFDHVPEALKQATLKSVDLIIQQRPDNPSAFTKPGQLCCFKHFTLLKNLELRLSPSLQSYNGGFASISVVRLTTFITEQSVYSDVNFGWLLAAFSLLEELNIYAFQNAFFIKEEKESSHPIYVKLKKLFIFTPMIHPTFLHRLSILAPNIKELSLTVTDESILTILKQKNLPPSMATQRFIASEVDYVWDITALDLDVFHLRFIRNKVIYPDSHVRIDVHFNLNVGQKKKELVCCGVRFVVPIEEYDKKGKLPKITLLFHKVKAIFLADGDEIVPGEDGIIMAKKPLMPICTSLPVFRSRLP